MFHVDIRGNVEPCGHKIHRYSMKAVAGPAGMERSLGEKTHGPDHLSSIDNHSYLCSHVALCCQNQVLNAVAEAPRRVSPSAGEPSCVGARS